LAINKKINIDLAVDSIRSSPLKYDRPLISCP
jgi:hypothetical protein